MAYNRSHARKLCSDPEFRLVEASFDKQLDALNASQLRSKVDRSRKLRDKQRDLLRRQRLAARAKTGTKVDVAKRTEQKEKLFAEVLSRFEARLAEVDRDAVRKAERDAASTKRADDGAKRTAKPAAKKAAAKAPSKTAAKSVAKTTAKPAAKSAAEPKAKKSSKPPAAPAPTRSKLNVEPDGPPGPTGRFVSEQANLAARDQKRGAARVKSIQGHVSSRVRRNQARRDSR